MTTECHGILDWILKQKKDIVETLEKLKMVCSLLYCTNVNPQF